jgi:hypothetical protein
MGGRSLPGRKRRALFEASPAAVGQLPFFDREHRTILDLDVPHDASAADLIGEPHVVAPWLDARDTQALVVVNCSIPIILALVGAPAVFAGRRHLKTSDRVQREIPKPNALAILGRNGGAHKSEYDQGKQRAAQPRLLDMGARKRPLLAQEPVDIVGIVEILGGRQVRLAWQTPKIIVAVD